MGRYTGGLIRAEPLSLTKFSSKSGMFSLGTVTQLIGSGNWADDYDVVLQFTDSGSWECPTGVSEIAEYVVVGGGAGGGSDMGGGGGAGGLRIGTGMPVVAGKTYSFGIGGGGTGGPGGPSGGAGTDGLKSSFLVEANVLYYVAVGGAVSPGTGNRYYVKSTNEFEGATANVEAETLKLYEGSTYRFDQSHPTNSGHPFRFSETVVSPASSATPYTTGVTTSQPSVGTGSPGSIVQIQVAASAPQLYYYCTSHPVSGSASMGGAADTIANVSIVSLGGGHGGSNQDSSGEAGGSGGGAGAPGGSGGAASPITVNPNAGETTPSQVQSNKSGFDGGDASGVNYGAGGGGGSGALGSDGSGTSGGAGGAGKTVSFYSSGTTTLAGGGGGGASGAGGVGGSSVGGTGGLGTTGVASAGTDGVVNTGSGGGGGAGHGGSNPVAPLTQGGEGGSGVVLIKYRNKNNNRVFKFTGSGVWKNEFGAKTIEYLIVGGGGSGGSNRGGGGGAGGLIFKSGHPVTPGTSYNISIGAGAPGSPSTFGTEGSNTVAFSVDAGGGGGGGAAPAANPNLGRGASGAGFAANAGPVGTGRGGGGVSGAQSPEQGNDGGAGGANSDIYTSGGGGGAGEEGFKGGPGGAIGAAPYQNNLNYGRGGNGVSYNIEGSTKFYAGGGGGSFDFPARAPQGPNTFTDPALFQGGLGGGGNGGGNLFPGVTGNGAVSEAGEANTGGGSGGGQGGGPDAASRNGGSGVVVIKITG